MKIVTLPLIATGQLIEVPITDVLVTNNAINFYIEFSIPAGVTYDSSSLPKGSYDSGTNRWNVGSVTAGELLQGLLYFTVTDDSKAPFEFVLTTSHSATYEPCIKITGPTCYQLQPCISAGSLARDSELVGVVGETVGPIDLTVNDGNCANKTYSWLNNANGALGGTPDAATYTPAALFFGTQIGEYGLYCNGQLTDTARVHLATSYAACTTQWVLSPTNAIYTGNVATSDLNCTNGAVTTYHLKNAPTADGPVMYDTTSSDVKVTNWNQATGDYQATSINSFEGVVFFDYFMRCTINGKSWDSFPGQEVLSVTASFPFSSSVTPSSSNPVSSSVPGSSSLTVSSSNPASSSAPASSSNTSSMTPPSSSATSSIVPPSSSVLIPSSNPAASSSVAFSSSAPTSSSVPVSSGTPPSSSFAFLSSSNVPSSSA